MQWYKIYYIYTLKLLRIILLTHSDFLEIGFPLAGSPTLAVPDNHQVGGYDGEADKCDADEAVLEAEVLDPRRDAVANSKADCVADQHQRGEAVSRDFTERIGKV